MLYSQNWRYAAQWLIWGVFVIVLVRTAWVCDDAFITMRCVHNATNGHGLTFNLVERVQAFTHPLWALILLPIHAIFKNGYWEMMLLGLVFTMAAMVIAGRQLNRTWAWIGLPIVAIASKAFVEYSTSGLENSLSYLLLALFVGQWWRAQQERGRLLQVALFAALTLVNRMDLLLIVGPATAIAFWRERSWHALRILLIGGMPFLLWEVFAVIYYGFPFPNTAYAKLGTFIPQSKLWEMGWNYMADSLHRDFVTLPVILLGVLSVVWQRKQWPLIVGVVLYMIFVARIGGDFMSGRFLVAPFWVCLLILCKILDDYIWGWAAFIAIPTALGLLSPTPMLLSNTTVVVSDAHLISDTGIADERAYYYSGTGLLHSFEDTTMPIHPWAKAGMANAKGGSAVRLKRAIGMMGYYGGPTQHLIDEFALSDPLLARIPAVYNNRPRPGHYLRRIPQGYLGSVIEPNSKIFDPIIRALDDKVRLVTRGSLWSLERWGAIISLNLHPQKLEGMWTYRLPYDQKIVLERGVPTSFSVFHRGTMRISLPPGIKEISFSRTNEIGCELVWMHDNVPIKGTSIYSIGTYRYKKPFGANAILFMREGSNFKSLVTNLIAE